MYELWREKHIKFPSEYWNASTGDKLVMKAFHYHEIEEKNKIIMELKREKTPIFPTTII